MYDAMWYIAMLTILLIKNYLWKAKVIYKQLLVILL